MFLARKYLSEARNFLMKKFCFAFLIFSLAIILLGACAPVVQTVEVTRVVTQIVQVNITTTSLPTLTPSLTPTPSITPTLTPSPTLRPTTHFEIPIRALTVTPGIQVISDNARPDVEKFFSKQYINDYLALQVGDANFGGKVFCGYQPFGMGNDGQKIQLYLWIVCQEYYWSGDGLKEGTGMSLPVVLFVEFRRGRYTIVDYKDPGNGFELLKQNFPPEIQNYLTLDLLGTETWRNWINTASQEAEGDAKAYFGIQ
jgi:hypothetical protein